MSKLEKDQMCEDLTLVVDILEPITCREKVSASMK